jgi:hypothetical protein
MKPHELDQIAVDETGPLREDVARTLRALDEALEEFPKEATQLLQAVEMGVVRVRDHLIDSFRRARGTDGASPVRRSLQLANCCLSLVIGVEYPQGQKHRSLLEQARELLVQLRDDHSTGSE